MSSLFSLFSITLVATKINMILVINITSAETEQINHATDHKSIPDTIILVESDGTQR